MNKGIYGLFVLLIVGLLVGCTNTSTGNVVQDNGQQQVTHQSAEPIKFGVIMPLTGDAAGIGQSIVRSVNLAADEINANGGIDGRQVQIIAEDGKCNGKDANNAMNKLAFVDGVHYIVGAGCSAETMAITSVAEANKIIMLSPASSNPAISTMGDYIFRDYPSDSLAGKFAAEYMYNHGARKVAVLSCLSDYCVGLKDVFIQRFQELGGTIVLKLEFAQGSRDLRTQLTQIKSSNPDLIYMPGYTDEVIVAFKQIKELGMDASKFIGGDAWDDPKIWTETKGISDGARYTVVAADAPQDFKDKYFAKYGKDAAITIGAVQAYDALYIFKKVIEQAGDNTEAVKTALYNVQNYKGVSGTISFDSNGDLKDASYNMWIVKDGTPVIEK